MKKIFLLFLLPTLLFSQTSHTVNAGMLYFYPSELTINIGDTVFWINDGGNHNVNFDISSLTSMSFNNPESFVSNPTTSANIYSHIFTIAGTYSYDCSVYGHASGGMTGTIIVNNITSVDEISTNKKFIEVYEILGGIMNNSNSKIKVYKYLDGTVEKRIVIK